MGWAQFNKRIRVQCLMGSVVTTLNVPYSLFLIGRVPFVPRTNHTFMDTLSEGNMLLRRHGCYNNMAQNRISVASVLNPLYLRWAFDIKQTWKKRALLVPSFIWQMLFSLDSSPPTWITAVPLHCYQVSSVERYFKHRETENQNCYSRRI